MKCKNLLLWACPLLFAMSSANAVDFDKPGWFKDVSSMRLPEILRDVTFGTLEADFGDLDNDGDLDIAMANDGDEPLVILWNQEASFLSYSLISLPGRVIADVDLGDINGDGFLDIVAGMADYYGAQNRLFLNNGDLTFTDVTETHMPINIDNTRDTDFADVDNDGDLDIVIANVVIILLEEQRQNLIYINDGTGHFADETLTSDGLAYRFPVDDASTRSILPLDVNADGHIDFVMANRSDPPLYGSGYDGPQDKIWINDGNGFFADETFRLPVEELNGNGRDLNAGDIDGDGDMDLVIGNAQSDFNLYSGGGQQNRVLINNGEGFFTDETLTPEGDAYRLPVQVELTKSVDLADVDNDGDLDILFANSRGENGFLAPQPGQQNRILINNGNGFFKDQSIFDDKRFRFPKRFDNTYDLDLGDVDGDGDLDIFLGEREESSRLFINYTLNEIVKAGRFEGVGEIGPFGLHSAGISKENIYEDFGIGIDNRIILTGETIFGELPLSPQDVEDGYLNTFQFLDEILLTGVERGLSDKLVITLPSKFTPSGDGLGMKYTLPEGNDLEIWKQFVATLVERYDGDNDYGEFIDSDVDAYFPGDGMYPNSELQAAMTANPFKHWQVEQEWLHQIYEEVNGVLELADGPTLAAHFEIMLDVIKTSDPNAIVITGAMNAYKPTMLLDGYIEKGYLEHGPRDCSSTLR